MFLSDVSRGFSQRFESNESGKLLSIMHYRCAKRNHHVYVYICIYLQVKSVRRLLIKAHGYVPPLIVCP